ncbi:hypothetical protein Droror1_Dr00012370 [Drosera rotundifolia]
MSEKDVLEKDVSEKEEKKNFIETKGTDFVEDEGYQYGGKDFDGYEDEKVEDDEEGKEIEVDKVEIPVDGGDHELYVGNDTEMVEEKVDEEMVEEGNIEEKKVKDPQDIVQGTLEDIKLQLSQDEGDDDDENEGIVQGLKAAEIDLE